MFNRFSTYSRPVNIRFPQCFQLSPQNLILRILRRKVMLYYFFGNGTDILQKLSVAGYIGNLQVESDTTLLSTFKIARTTKF